MSITATKVVYIFLCNLPQQNNLDPMSEFLVQKGKLINTMLESVLMAIKYILTQALALFCAFSYDVLYLLLLLWFPRVSLVDIIILKTDDADTNLFLSPNDALGCEFLEMLAMASNSFTLITLTPVSQYPSIDPKIHWLLEVQ